MSDIRTQHREFIIAQAKQAKQGTRPITYPAPDHIRGPNTGTNSLGNLLDHLITYLRPEGSVNALKLAESDVQHHKSIVIAFRSP